MKSLVTFQNLPTVLISLLPILSNHFPALKYSMILHPSYLMLMKTNVYQHSSCKCNNYNITKSLFQFLFYYEYCSDNFLFL